MNIDYRAAARLAEDIQATHISIDDALEHVANLTNSVVNVCRSSSIPPSKSQATIESIANGFTRLVDARHGFVDAHRHIAKVQRDSNLEAIDFGCLDQNPMAKADKLKLVNG